MVDINTLNNFYNILDLYLVTSRLRVDRKQFLNVHKQKQK